MKQMHKNTVQVLITRILDKQKNIDKHSDCTLNNKKKLNIIFKSDQIFDLNTCIFYIDVLF